MTIKVLREWSISTLVIEEIMSTARQANHTELRHQIWHHLTRAPHDRHYP